MARKTNQKEPPRTREIALVQWQQDWLEADFTWVGLGDPRKHKWFGWEVWTGSDGEKYAVGNGVRFGKECQKHGIPKEPRVATLQDYWAADPVTGRIRSKEEMVDELWWPGKDDGIDQVDVPEKHIYHIAHIPIEHPEFVSPKKSWRSAGKFHSALGYGRRNNLDSLESRIWRVIDQRKLAAVCILSQNAENPNQSKRHYGNGKPPVSAMQLQGSTLGRFSPSTHRHSELPNRPLNIDLSCAVLCNDFRMIDWIADEDVILNNALFLGDFSTHGSNLVGITASEAIFLGSVSVMQSHIGSITLIKSHFFKNLVLSNLNIEGWLDLDFAEFKPGSLAKFCKCEIGTNEKNYTPGVTAQGADFGGHFSLEEAIVFGPLNFEGASFSEQAKYSGQFKNEAIFSGVSFGGDASFSGSIFGSEKEGQSSFDNAKFYGIANFNDVEFDSANSFRSTLFVRAPKFHNAKIHPDSTFDGAKFAGVNLALRRASAPFWVGVTLCLLILGQTFSIQNSLAPWILYTIWSIVLLLASCLLIWVKYGGYIVEGRDDRMQEERERGFRRLRQHSQSLNNAPDEYRFHSLEMRARRLRKGTNITERAFSWFYDTVSTYGNSIGKPIFCLGMSVGAYSVLYYLWADAAGAYSHIGSCRSLISGGGDYSICHLSSHDALLQAFMFSWSNVFQPLSALASDDSANELAYWLLFDEHGKIDGWGVMARVVATSQSLLSVTLALLIALAVRRRLAIG